MSTPQLSLTLVQLRCFVTVAELGSFAAAGRHIGLSTSAVSKTIARLEKVRGVRLLNRSTHALSLTPEGEHLLNLSRDAVRSMEHVELAFNNAVGVSASGRVRLSAPTAFISARLAPLLTRFHAQHPDILLDLRASDVMADLADDAIDLALRTGDLVGIPGHLQQALFRFPWITCASPGYFACHVVPRSSAELAGHDLIGFRNQRTGLVDAWRYRYRDNMPAQTIRWLPSPSIIIDDANAALAAAISGAGIIWAPAWLVADALRNGFLSSVMTEWSGNDMKMSIIRRAQHPTPERIDHVIAFLKENRDFFIELP